MDTLRERLTGCGHAEGEIDSLGVTQMAIAPANNSIREGQGSHYSPTGSNIYANEYKCRTEAQLSTAMLIPDYVCYKGSCSYNYVTVPHFKTALLTMTT